MAPLLPKLVIVAIVAGLAVMVLRDLYLGRVPGVRGGFIPRYARRQETPVLFWLLTIGRAAVIGLAAVAILRL